MTDPIAEKIAEWRRVAEPGRYPPDDYNKGQEDALLAVADELEALLEGATVVGPLGGWVYFIPDKPSEEPKP